MKKQNCTAGLRLDEASCFWSESAHVLADDMFTRSMLKNVFRITSKTWNSHMHLQSKSHVRNNFLHTICFCGWRVRLFSAGFLCLFGELMENKSSWMTFWRGVICCAWTRAGGLSVVLDPIKGGVNEFPVCTPHLLPQFWAPRLFVHSTNNEGKAKLESDECMNRNVCVTEREIYFTVFVYW